MKEGGQNFTTLTWVEPVGRDAEAFDDWDTAMQTIRKLLDDGWELHGSPAVLPDGRMVQALHYPARSRTLCEGRP